MDRILQRVSGDFETAQTRFSQALEIQQRLGDHEVAGLSLGGLARLAAVRGDLADALDLYRQSLRRVRSDRRPSGEARILDEMGSTYLRSGGSVAARQTFLDSYRPTLTWRAYVVSGCR
jgi:tetratricopeptide (TPR) repeat protein